MISKIRWKGIVASIVMGAAVGLLVPAPFAAAQTAGRAGFSAQSLDFEFFKTRVAPIFLKNRSREHARCYSCHVQSRGATYEYLEKLPPGATFWTDEQLRRIFQNVSRLVTPGNPTTSRIVMHPLAPEAGGGSDNGLHSGGRQFESQDDPDWKTLVGWVRGAKTGP